MDVGLAWLGSLQRSCVPKSFCEMPPASADDSVPLHFELYTEASRSVREVLREVSSAIAV